MLSLRKDSAAASKVLLGLCDYTAKMSSAMFALSQHEDLSSLGTALAQGIAAALASIGLIDIAETETWGKVLKAAETMREEAEKVQPAPVVGRLQEWKKRPDVQIIEAPKMGIVIGYCYCCGKGTQNDKLVRLSCGHTVDFACLIGYPTTR